MKNDYKSFIVQDPDKRLHTPCIKVTNFRAAKEIADKLIEVTKEVDGHLKPWLGMAAPQVGYNKRVIILKKLFENYEVMINPEIIEKRWNIPTFSRCFSVEGIYIIRAYYWIKVKYQDLQGYYHTEVISGGKAATLQQETDHINGILISDIGFRLF